MTTLRHAAAAGLLLVLFAGTAPAHARAQSTHLLVVVGLGGSEEFRGRFLEWGVALRQTAMERYGLSAEQAVLLAEDPSMHAGVSASSRREDVSAAFERIASRAGPDDRVLVVLLGHGSSRGEETRFNLPGPDLTAGEFAALLDALPTRRVALVNASSASGPFIRALAAPGRTVITATKTGRERNESRFGGYFSDAFGNEGADLDKNGAVSLLEAFTFARRETARHYAEASLLLTEHAMLDDDGDGEGTEEPGPDTSDGALAALFTLGASGALVTAMGVEGLEGSPATTDSVLARLYRERTVLEGRVVEFRRNRSGVDPQEYDRRLEELLVELALKSREVRAREGGGS